MACIFHNSHLSQNKNPDGLELLTLVQPNYPLLYHIIEAEFNSICSRVSEYGENGKYFFYLQGPSLAGCYNTIKLQNLLFL